MNEKAKGRIVSPEVAMAILVYDYGMSSSEALVYIMRILEKEKNDDHSRHMAVIPALADRTCRNSAG
jgi:hypothetical protein